MYLPPTMVSLKCSSEESAGSLQPVPAAIPLIDIAVLLPSPIRDAVYNLVARNRYRWFGRRDTCMIPTPDIAARFLDADEPRAPTEA